MILNLSPFFLSQGFRMQRIHSELGDIPLLPGPGMTSLMSGKARTQISDAALKPMKAWACLRKELVAKSRRHRNLLRWGLQAAPLQLYSLGWGPEHIRRTIVPVMTTSWHKVSLEEKGSTEITTFWNVMERGWFHSLPLYCTVQIITAAYNKKQKSQGKTKLNSCLTNIKEQGFCSRRQSR